jgi:hypothetical protein
VMTLVSLKAFSLSGGAFKGSVVDEDGRPIEGAIVAVRWLGDVPAGPDSHTNCYHVATTLSRANGDYQTPAWVKFSLKTILVSQDAPTGRAYKTGYVQVAERSSRETLVLKPFTGTDEEYFATRLLAVSCSSAGESEKSLYHVYNLIANESDSIAKTREQLARTQAIRRLANQTLVNRSKPTVFEGGFIRNMDMNDNYKVEELAK